MNNKRPTFRHVCVRKQGVCTKEKYEYGQQSGRVSFRLLVHSSRKFTKNLQIQRSVSLDFFDKNPHVKHSSGILMAFERADHSLQAFYGTSWDAAHDGMHHRGQHTAAVE